MTLELKGRNVSHAMRHIPWRLPDWGGGTRIGDALRTFNTRWARRVMGHGPVVLVISDGWDRGEPDVLRREMARLHRSARRLIWLNPLLGSPDYRPLTRGMQAALPFIDDFLPVHNLASLEALSHHLNLLEAGVKAIPTDGPEDIRRIGPSSTSKPIPATAVPRAQSTRRRPRVRSRGRSCRCPRRKFDGRFTSDEARRSTASTTRRYECGGFLSSIETLPV